MTQEELEEILILELKGLSSKVTSNDLANAVSNAQRDTGWTLPQTTDFRIQWLKERTKRWIFFFLWSESAHKFKFEQINLQHRFDHYERLIKYMDELFENAKLENIAEFAGASAYEMFGTKIEAGFQYDDLGNDTTYSNNNRVIIEPGEETA
jgi:hypothetical protein